jgi:DNA mismatch repair ATPase MutS
LPVIALNLYLLGLNHAKTSKVVEQTSSVVKLLRTYVNHIRLVKGTTFNAAFSQQLQATLNDSMADAEKEIQQLSKLLDQLQARTNLLHIFINIPLLLDLQWMTRLNQWKKEKKDHLRTWTDNLAEFEVLVSLAGTAFINEDWCFPAITTEEYVLVGKGVGHPLISSEKRVGNDFSLRGAGLAVIITGPNMAGKSTFLRTIAINVVLAQMGAPVCATAMTVSQEMKVFTAMRTQDNLSENISSFYAELDRIQQLLKEIAAGDKVLYFLDELLKGTNSADRHRGAEALVKQLVAQNVTGFVSTHDIELGQLTREMPQVSNYSFESTISEGQIDFDYKIRDGICSSFNASELMRQMGINI